jgi:hypothetical protein
LKIILPKRNIATEIIHAAKTVRRAVLRRSSSSASGNSARNIDSAKNGVIKKKNFKNSEMKNRMAELYHFYPRT